MVGCLIFFGMLVFLRRSLIRRILSVFRKGLRRYIQLVFFKFMSRCFIVFLFRNFLVFRERNILIFFIKCLRCRLRMIFVFVWVKLFIFGFRCWRLGIFFNLFLRICGFFLIFFFFRCFFSSKYNVIVFLVLNQLEKLFNLFILKWLGNFFKVWVIRTEIFFIFGFCELRGLGL